jgi:hypothetical protein
LYTRLHDGMYQKTSSFPSWFIELSYVCVDLFCFLLLTGRVVGCNRWQMAWHVLKHVYPSVLICLNFFLNGVSMCLRNISNHLPHYTVS